MAILLSELSDDDDTDDEDADPLPGNGSDSWRHSFDGYLNSPDRLTKGQSIVQWWGVSSYYPL